MKKLLLLLFVGIVGIGNAQNVYIPDANFKAYLVWQASINTNGDAEIQVSEAAAFGGEIDCQSQGISDLTGIEAFTNLTDLNCGGNPLTNLDVTNNTALEYLWCSGNLLTSLDVTNNTALTDLRCGGNQLTSLDVTQNTALTDLNCGGNPLTNLDVTQNTDLTDLYCGNSQLTSLNLNGAAALTLLDCGLNQLTSLDVTQNTALFQLSCADNQLTSLDVTQNTALSNLSCRNNQLTSLDLSQNTAFTWLDCEYNQLTCLNIKNGNNYNYYLFRAEFNPNLFCIEVDNVGFSTTYWVDGIDTWVSFSTACNNPCVVGVANADTPSLSIYPNPSSTGLIQLNTSIVNSDINVYSIEGKQINFTQSNNVIDISDNEKGVYLISIDGVVTRYVYQD